MAHARKHAKSRKAFNTVTLEAAHRVLFAVVDAALNGRGIDE